MSLSPYTKVLEFHMRFGVAIREVSEKLYNLRHSLIKEEAKEVLEELESRNRAGIAKELADLVYVCYGTAITLGIDLDEAIRRVHDSNMSKLDENFKPILRADGKVLKSHLYKEADLNDL